jgi:acyl carrier protein
MTTTTVEEAVRTAILRVAPESDLATLEPDESLRAALDLDSLDFLAVLEHVARLTLVTIPERAYAAVDSWRGLVDYVRDNAKAAG